MGLLDPPAYSRAAADARYTRGAPWLTLPYGWDATWKAAKAAQGTTPARIAVVGDSIATGQGSTNWLTKGWPAVLRDTLVAGGMTYGGEAICATSYGSQTLTSQVGTLPFAPVSGAGTSVVEGGYGRSLICPTSTPAETITTPIACTAVDIYYIDYSAGTWTYTVDGGTAQTVTCTGPGNQANAKVKRVAITGLTSGVHTIAIGGSSGSNVLILWGAAWYTQTTSGLQIARSTYPGMRAVDLSTTRGSNTGSGGLSSFPSDKIALWQGQVPQGDSPTTQTGFGFPTQPHLAIISLGVNDCDLGAPPKNYRNALRRLISAFRRGVDNASIALVVQSHPDNSVSSDTTIGGKGYQWQEFKAIQAEVSHTYGCALVDIDSKWGAYATGKGFLPSADIHPTDAGHADMAATLAQIL